MPSYARLKNYILTQFLFTVILFVKLWSSVFHCDE